MKSTLPTVFNVTDADFGNLFPIGEPQIVSENEPEFEDDESYFATVTYPAASDPTDENAVVYLVVAKAKGYCRGAAFDTVEIVSTTRIADDRVKTRFAIDALTLDEGEKIWPEAIHHGPWM